VFDTRLARETSVLQIPRETAGRYYVTSTAHVLMGSSLIFIALLFLGTCVQ
jgi:hypothetical protein